jgi:hypothetical protein
MCAIVAGMDSIRGVFAGVAMALGLLVVCVGLALKMIDDQAWALAAGGAATLVLGAIATEIKESAVKR